MAGFINLFMLPDFAGPIKSQDAMLSRETNRKPMTLKLKKFAPLLVLAALMLAAYAAGLHETLGFEALQEHKDRMQAFVVAHPVLASGIFMGVYALCVALSLPVATVLTLLGGALFGVLAGTALVVAAATAGATLLFLIARSALGSSLREKAGTVYQKIEREMQQNAAGYLLFMRLVPLFPFWLVNIVPALFNVKPGVFIVTTFIGIIPGTFVYVNVGSELGKIANPGDIFSPGMLAAFALLGVCALLPGLYKHWKSSKGRSND